MLPPEDPMLTGAGWSKAGAQLDVEVVVQPKQLRLTVKVLGLSVGMRAEPVMWEVLLEHSELLARQLEEMEGIWRGQEELQKWVSAIRSLFDNIAEHEVQVMEDEVDRRNWKGKWRSEIKKYGV